MSCYFFQWNKYLEIDQTRIVSVRSIMARILGQACLDWSWLPYKFWAVADVVGVTGVVNTVGHLIACSSSPAGRDWPPHGTSLKTSCPWSAKWSSCEKNSRNKKKEIKKLCCSKNPDQINKASWFIAHTLLSLVVIFTLCNFSFSIKCIC